MGCGGDGKMVAWVRRVGLDVALNRSCSSEEVLFDLDAVMGVG